jgi:hypothetical protein
MERTNPIESTAPLSRDRETMLEIGYCTIDQTVDLSFDTSAANQLTPQDLIKYNAENCAICQELLVPKYDGHCVVQGEKCKHMFHATCFFEDLHFKYVDSEMISNFCHILVPAISCPMCKQFGGWSMLNKKQKVPDDVRVFADTWGDNQRICDNWITCPILYKALQSKIVTKKLGPVTLPPDYGIGRYTTKKMLDKHADAYFESTVPLSLCSSCKIMTPMHLLNRHMRSSSFAKK